MDQQMFICLVRRTEAHESVRLQFKHNDWEGLSYLYTIRIANEGVQFCERDMIALDAAVHTKNWGGAHAPIIVVQGLSSLDGTMLSALAPHIEKAEFADEHEATGLMHAWARKRNESARTILTGVNTQAFMEELRENGYRIAGSSAKHEGVPCVKFHITKGKVHSFVVRVDGWSGKIALGDAVLRGELYKSPAQLQKIIRGTLLRVTKRSIAAAVV